MADVASMTGFADAIQTTKFGSITVELKSVNGRFLEVSLRLPEELRFAEAQVRERIGAAVSRGKLDCRVSVTRDAAAAGTRVNATVLGQIAELAHQVQKALPQATPMGIGEILRWPGVIESESGEPDAWRESLLDALDRALQGLQQSRTREGASLATALRERCSGIETIVGRLRANMPRILSETERRMNERITQALGNSLGASVNPGGLTREEINERVRQEVTLQGSRSDVAEEMDRLSTHVTEVRRVLDKGGAVGRRLDFLMQELNRESNTIASKASVVETTGAAVELKLFIEQMREQVQNLE
jgi:uncharacterized protein (TIGR00255 family)